MKLYSTPISPNGKRVRIAAAELGASLEGVSLDFGKGENRAADYLELNPLGKVPTLTDGKFVLFESAAIVWYLASSTHHALAPTEPQAQADALRWMFYGSCHLDPNYTILVVERFIKPRRNLPEDAHLTEYALGQLARFLPIVEQQLAGRQFLTGAFGLADIVLGCTLELSPLLRVELAPYPNVRGWLERLQARPSWRGAAA